MMNFSDEYGHWRLQLDMTKLAASILRHRDRSGDKYMLNQLLMALLSGITRTSEILGSVAPEAVQQLPGFYERRADAWRRAMRVRRIFSLRSAASIEREVADLAWRDTREMMENMMFSAHDATLRGLVEEQRAAMRMLTQTLINLIEGYRAGTLDVDSLMRGELPEGDAI